MSSGAWPTHDYACIMQTNPGRVRVAFRELSEGSLWHCGEGEPKPSAVLSCNIRRGRSPERRAELAQALVDACVEALDLRSALLVQFTNIRGTSRIALAKDGRRLDVSRCEDAKRKSGRARPSSSPKFWDVDSAVPQC